MIFFFNKLVWSIIKSINTFFHAKYAIFLSLGLLFAYITRQWWRVMISNQKIACEKVKDLEPSN